MRIIPYGFFKETIYRSFKGLHMSTNIDNLDLNKLNPLQLKALTEKAQQIIEQKQKEEIDQAYAKLVEIANGVGLTLDELLEHGQKKKSKPTRKVAPRYRNPQNPNQTWTGRGKKPHWVVNALANGLSLEDLAI